MEELKVTPQELKDIIEDNEKLGRGFFGTVFRYKDRVIKLENNLYGLLKYNDRILSDEMVDYRYRFGKENFVDPEQIATLASKQKNITLTKMPQGVVSVNGAVAGVILPYHANHQSLEMLSKNEYRTLLVILKKLLLAVQELADNQIAQTDLIHHENKWDKDWKYNILYKGDTPQIIDLDGDRIICGKEFQDANEMYNELGHVILSYFDANKLPIDVSSSDITDEKKARDLINELENRVRGK